MKSYCFECSKKVPKFIFNQCKCENYFCNNCLPFFKHNCSYDYKQDKKDKLRSENIIVVNDKVVKI